MNKIFIAVLLSFLLSVQLVVAYETMNLNHYRRLGEDKISIVYTNNKIKLLNGTLDYDAYSCYTKDKYSNNFHLYYDPELKLFSFQEGNNILDNTPFICYGLSKHRFLIGFLQFLGFIILGVTFMALCDFIQERKPKYKFDV
jgi:hypothetical protein